MSAIRSLSKVNWTCRGHGEIGAIDPSRTGLARPGFLGDRPPKFLFGLDEAGKIASEERPKRRARLFKSIFDFGSFKDLADAGGQPLNDDIGNPLGSKDSAPADRQRALELFPPRLVNQERWSRAPWP